MTMIWCRMNDGKWFNFSVNFSDLSTRQLIRVLVSYTVVAIYKDSKWMQLFEDEGSGPGGFALQPLG